MSSGSGVRCWEPLRSPPAGGRDELEHAGLVVKFGPCALKVHGRSLSTSSLSISVGRMPCVRFRRNLELGLGVAKRLALSSNARLQRPRHRGEPAARNEVGWVSGGADCRPRGPAETRATRILKD